MAARSNKQKRNDRARHRIRRAKRREERAQNEAAIRTYGRVPLDGPEHVPLFEGDAR